MSTWQEKNAALLAELAETPNPSVRGNAIGCYLRDAWGLEAYQLNQEKQPHYILDGYLTYLRAEGNPEALAKLLAARRSRRRPFDKGPYHDEYYPGEQCAYEELLLQGRFFQAEDKQIRGEIEELLVELYLLQE